MHCPLCHTARESDQSFRCELHVLLGLNKRSGTRPLADFTAMSTSFRGTGAGANERDDRESKVVAVAIRDGEFERVAKEMSV